MDGTDHEDATRRRGRRTTTRERPGAPERWAAPVATGSVAARVPVPGSKSMTARALMLAAGSVGPSTLLHPSESRDSIVLARGLRGMGAHVSSVDDERWLLRPRPLHGSEVDVECSGTAMRFLPALAGLADGDVVFSGDAVLHGYPMGELARALSSLGVEADTVDNGLPLTVHGLGRVPGGEVSLDASGSSQLVSGLLLAGTDFDRGLLLRHVGPPFSSARSHIELTVRMMRSVGAAVDDSTPDVWEVEPGRLVGRAWSIEPDLAGAMPFLAAALVTGGRITVPDWPAQPVQAAATLLRLLGELGADCALTDEGLTVTGAGIPHGIDADVSSLCDLVPTLAVVCALADAPSTLRGVGRVSGLVGALGTLGGTAEAGDDTLTITPRPLRGGEFDTLGDHRLAYAGAVLGLAVPGVVLSDVACTAKTLPEFPDRWRRMLDETLGEPR